MTTNQISEIEALKVAKDLSWDEVTKLKYGSPITRAAVWNLRAQKVRGFDPDRVRLSPCGALILNGIDTMGGEPGEFEEFDWFVDHIDPDGPDDFTNLQPLSLGVQERYARASGKHKPHFWGKGSLMVDAVMSAIRNPELAPYLICYHKVKYETVMSIVAKAAPDSLPTGTTFQTWEEWFEQEIKGGDQEAFSANMTETAKWIAAHLRDMESISLREEQEYGHLVGEAVSEIFNRVMIDTKVKKYADGGGARFIKAFSKYVGANPGIFTSITLPSEKD